MHALPTLRRSVVACLAVTVAALAGAATSQAAPANDGFANAKAIAGASASLPQTLIGSTLEPGEAALYGAAHGSVWYSWTAPATGPVVAWVCDDTYDQDGFLYLPRVRAFTGSSLLGLSAVANTRTGVCLDASPSFTATQGVTYRFQVTTSGADYPTLSTFNVEQRTSAKTTWPSTPGPGTTGPAGKVALGALPVKNAWQGFDDPAQTECTVDGTTAAIDTCTGAHLTFSGLAEGKHTWAIRARDPWGFWASWVTGSLAVDATPPLLSVTNTAAPDKAPELAYGANEPVINRACSSDQGASWGTCPVAWPIHDGKGAPAAGKVLYRAADAVYNPGATVSYTWAGPPPPAAPVTPVTPVVPATTPVAPPVVPGVVPPTITAPIGSTPPPVTVARRPSRLALTTRLRARRLTVTVSSRPTGTVRLTVTYYDRAGRRRTTVRKALTLRAGKAVVALRPPRGARRATVRAELAQTAGWTGVTTIRTARLP